MPEEKVVSNPPEGMVPCKVLKPLGPHEVGAEILMHRGDAFRYHCDGIVRGEPAVIKKIAADLTKAAAADEPKEEADADQE